MSLRVVLFCLSSAGGIIRINFSNFFFSELYGIIFKNLFELKKVKRDRERHHANLYWYE
jgi:hypothetical protein